VKLALISDIHANLEALAATLADISAQDVDRIVCLGDIVGYNANPAECIRLIRDCNALCVAGNHDLAVCGSITTENFSSVAARSIEWTRPQLTADALVFLAALPLKATIDSQLIAVHGALHPETGCERVRLDTEARRMESFQALAAHPSGARICAFGHTHRAGVYEFRDGEVVERTGEQIRLCDDGYYLINPGTVGEPRARDRRASYMVLDLKRRVVTLRRIDYDADMPFLAAREAGLVPRFGFSRLKQTLRDLVET